VLALLLLGAAECLHDVRLLQDGLVTMLFGTVLHFGDDGGEGAASGNKQVAALPLLGG
jgi:hypothetical protein